MSLGYTIGALSQESGVNAETIRYYEKIGLLPEPPRSAAGYRRYGDTAVTRLLFIRRGRELGFGIEEIRTLLQLADHPDAPCAEADALAKRHLADVEKKLQDLSAMRDELARLVGCKSRTAEHCRLVESLSRHARYGFE